MTRTVTAGPSLFRGGFSSARYVPSGSALTGRSANEAEARHRMCAPVASTARARDHDRNCRSASTSIPGPKQPSRSAASDCSASVHRPMAAPSMLPVPDSAAATHRTCGNAPSRDWFDGRPLAPGPSSGKTYKRASGSLLITEVEVQAAACRDRVDQGLQLRRRGRL